MHTVTASIIMVDHSFLSDAQSKTPPPAPPRSREGSISPTARDLPADQMRPDDLARPRRIAHQRINRFEIVVIAREILILAAPGIADEQAAVRLIRAANRRGTSAPRPQLAKKGQSPGQ